MRLLLDTHSFLWAAFCPETLSHRGKEAILDQGNDVLVSVITFWEISLKHALGKLELHDVTPEDLPEAARKMGLEIMPITPSDAASFGRLPREGHRDPFDRMLVWQAINQDCTLVSKDASLQVYGERGLKLLW